MIPVSVSEFRNEKSWILSGNLGSTRTERLRKLPGLPKKVDPSIAFGAKAPEASKEFSGLSQLVQKAYGVGLRLRIAANREIS